MSTFVWDMIGKFKVMSVNGANYSHDAVEPGVGLRFGDPVKRAHADAFIEVLSTSIAFLGTLPTNFVFKVFRADAGTVYKSKAVQEYLKSQGIACQYACIESSHQISVAERNHGVLLSTMRAIMSLSHAPKRFWAAALLYLAILNNCMATQYKSSATAHIPWMSVGMKYPLSLLLPFGCFVIIFKTKKQVADGKLDSRGVYGIFIGNCIVQGVKGVRVLEH